MEFRHLEAFIYTAKYKSFSKAADALFLSQPTISAQIGSLEKELGVVLFHRGLREISLTPKGEELYTYAVDLLNIRDAAIMKMEESKEPDGILNIQTSSIPGQFLLPDLITEFHNRYPGIQFNIEQSDSRIVNENILSQKGDLGFTGSKKDAGLIYEPVFTDEMVLVTPVRDKYRGYEDGTVLPISFFMEEPFIMREEGSGTKEELQSIVSGHDNLLKNVYVSARMNHTDTIKACVSRGLGVSMVSLSAAKQSLKGEEFRYFKIEEFSRKRTFYMTYRQNALFSPSADLFVKFVKGYRKQQ